MCGGIVSHARFVRCSHVNACRGGSGEQTVARARARAIAGRLVGAGGGAGRGRRGRPGIDATEGPISTRPSRTRGPSRGNLTGSSLGGGGVPRGSYRRRVRRGSGQVAGVGRAGA